MGQCIGRALRMLLIPRKVVDALDDAVCDQPEDWLSSVAADRHRSDLDRFYRRYRGNEIAFLVAPLKGPCSPRVEEP